MVSIHCDFSSKTSYESDNYYMAHSPIENDVLIIGAGGHGAVVLDVLRAQGKYRPIGFIDAEPALTGKIIGDVHVLGPLNLLPKLRGKVGKAIIAIGDNRIRWSYARKLAADGFELINAIHPSAQISPTATLGKNIVICAGAIISTSAKIADSALINTGALVEHECIIGQAVHLGPACKLAGRVEVEKGAFVGIGACIIQCLKIASHATIGAGAVVIRDVAEGDTVVGVPAKSLKQRRAVA